MNLIQVSKSILLINYIRMNIFKNILFINDSRTNINNIFI